MQEPEQEFSRRRIFPLPDKPIIPWPDEPIFPRPDNPIIPRPDWTRLVLLWIARQSATKRWLIIGALAMSFIIGVTTLFVSLPNKWRAVLVAALFIGLAFFLYSK